MMATSGSFGGHRFCISEWTSNAKAFCRSFSGFFSGSADSDNVNALDTAHAGS
jgi:hypothetical protein